MTIFFRKPEQEKKRRSSTSHKSSKSSSRPASPSEPSSPTSTKSSKHSSSRRDSKTSRRSYSTDLTSHSDSGSLNNEKLFISTFGPAPPKDLRIFTQSRMSSPTKKDFKDLKDFSAHNGQGLPLPGLSGSANGPVGNLLKGAVAENGQLKDAALMVGIKLDIEAEVHLTARIRGDILVGLY